MKKKISVLLVLFFLLFLVLNETVGYSFSDTKNYTNWPLQRMDTQNTAFTTAKYSSDMEFSEFLDVHSRHAPIIANNYYYLIEWETGEVHCYEIETKKLVWKKLYSSVRDEELRVGNVLAFSVSTSQLILLETVKGNWGKKCDFVSRVYSLNPENGLIIWQKDIDGFYANSITIGENVAYVKVIEIKRDRDSNYLSKNHKIVCFSLKSGHPYWSSQLLQGGEAYWDANVFSSNNQYIITSSSNCIYHHVYKGGISLDDPCYMNVLDITTGKLIDIAVLEGFVGASISLLSENKIFVVATISGMNLYNYMFCFEIKDKCMELVKKIKLSDEMHSFIYNVNLSQYDEYIYFLDYSGLLVCISTKTCEIQWEKRVGRKSWVGPYFCNEDYLMICSKYTKSFDDELVADISYIKVQYIDPLTGNELFCNPVKFDGSSPRELTGTDNHIWAICGKKVAHFTPAPNPLLEVSPLNIDVVCMEGDTDQVEKIITLKPIGHVKGTISCKDDWVDINRSSINEKSRFVNVMIDPTNMPIGTSKSEIIFKSNGGDAVVSVTLAIIEYPKLKVIPEKIDLTIKEGTVPDPTLFYIDNVGGKGLVGEITETIDWLELSESVVNDELTEFYASYKTARMKPGEYNGIIEIVSNGGNKSIPVVLTITPKPFLVVNPMNIVKEVPIGSSESVTLTLKNTGGEGLFGDISSNKDWLLPSRNIYKDDTATIFLVLTARDLKAGTYHGEVTFTGNDQVVTVTVTLKCIVLITFKIGSTTVEVNKVKEIISSAPYLFEKRTYVPVRKLVESIPVLNYLKNAEMKWDPIERKVTIILGEKIIELWVDNPMAKINHVDTPIDPNNSNIAPQIRSGRTFLPLRFIAENLGYTVEWVASTQTIHIKYVVDEA